MGRIQYKQVIDRLNSCMQFIWKYETLGNRYKPLRIYTNNIWYIWASFIISIMVLELLAFIFRSLIYICGLVLTLILLIWLTVYAARLFLRLSVYPLSLGVIRNSAKSGNCEVFERQLQDEIFAVHKYFGKLVSKSHSFQQLEELDEQGHRRSCLILLHTRQILLEMLTADKLSLHGKRLLHELTVLIVAYDLVRVSFQENLGYGWRITANDSQSPDDDRTPTAFNVLVALYKLQSLETVPSSVLTRCTHALTMDKSMHSEKLGVASDYDWFLVADSAVRDQAGKRMEGLIHTMQYNVQHGQPSNDFNLGHADPQSGEQHNLLPRSTPSSADAELSKHEWIKATEQQPIETQCLVHQLVSSKSLQALQIGHMAAEAAFAAVADFMSPPTPRLPFSGAVQLNSINPNSTFAYKLGHHGAVGVMQSCFYLNVAAQFVWKRIIRKLVTTLAKYVACTFRFCLPRQFELTVEQSPEIQIAEQYPVTVDAVNSAPSESHASIAQNSLPDIAFYGGILLNSFTKLPLVRGNPSSTSAVHIPPDDVSFDTIIRLFYPHCEFKDSNLQTLASRTNDKWSLSSDANEDDDNIWTQMMNAIGPKAFLVEQQDDPSYFFRFELQNCLVGARPLACPRIIHEPTILRRVRYVFNYILRTYRDILVEVGSAYKSTVLQRHQNRCAALTCASCMYYVTCTCCIRPSRACRTNIEIPHGDVSERYNRETYLNPWEYIPDTLDAIFIPSPIAIKQSKCGNMTTCDNVHHEFDTVSQQSDIQPFSITSRPTILFCQPNGGLYEYDFQLSASLSVLLEEGYHLILWNYRGCTDEDDEMPTPKVCAEDAERLIRYVRNHPDISNCISSLFVHGASVGGVPACFVGSLGLVDGLIADKNFSTVPHTARWLFGNWARIALQFVAPDETWTWSNVPTFLQAKCPKCIIVDTEFDSIIHPGASLAFGVANYLQSHVVQQLFVMAYPSKSICADMWRESIRSPVHATRQLARILRDVYNGSTDTADFKSHIFPRIASDISDLSQRRIRCVRPKFVHCCQRPNAQRTNDVNTILSRNPSSQNCYDSSIDMQHSTNSITDRLQSGGMIETTRVNLSRNAIIREERIVTETATEDITIYDALIGQMAKGMYFIVNRLSIRVARVLFLSSELHEFSLFRSMTHDNRLSANKNQDHNVTSPHTQIPEESKHSQPPAMVRCRAKLTEIFSHFYAPEHVPEHYIDTKYLCDTIDRTASLGTVLLEPAIKYLCSLRFTQSEDSLRAFWVDVQHCVLSTTFHDFGCEFNPKQSVGRYSRRAIELIELGNSSSTQEWFQELFDVSTSFAALIVLLCSTNALQTQFSGSFKSGIDGVHTFFAHHLTYSRMQEKTLFYDNQNVVATSDQQFSNNSNTKYDWISTLNLLYNVIYQVDPIVGRKCSQTLEQTNESDNSNMEILLILEKFFTQNVSANSMDELNHTLPLYRMNKMNETTVTMALFDIMWLCMQISTVGALTTVIRVSQNSPTLLNIADRHEIFHQHTGDFLGGIIRLQNGHDLSWTPEELRHHLLTWLGKISVKNLSS